MELALRDRLVAHERGERARHGLVLLDFHGGEGLDERPVRDSLAVGEAAAAQELCIETPEELCDEARLPGARRRGEGHDPRVSVFLDRAPDRLEPVEFLGAPDERRVRTNGRCVEQRYGLPHLNRLALPLRQDWVSRAQLDLGPRRLVRPPADENAVDGSRRLNARGRVQDVAGDDARGARPSCSDRDERLPRRDPESRVQVEPRLVRVQRGDGVTCCERRPHRAHRVVLVCLLGAEEPDNRVPDELLHHPAVLLDRSPHRLVEPEQPQPYVFDVESLGGRGRADDVGEERGDGATFLERRRGRERPPARRAESRVVRELRAARRAGDLSSSVRQVLLRPVAEPR